MFKLHETTDLGKTASGLLSSLLAKRKGKRTILGIAGGRTVPFVFSGAKADWAKVHLFLVDERLVGLDDPGSNFKSVKRNFLKHAKIPERNTHPFLVSKGAGQYSAELEKYGGKFDIALLSCGEDGHIGGLFPRESVLDDSRGFIVFHDSPKPPADRMSMSRKLFLKTGTVILVFAGEEKRSALAKFLNNKTAWKDCPAKLCLKVADCHIVTDLKLK